MVRTKSWMAVVAMLAASELAIAQPGAGPIAPPGLTSPGGSANKPGAPSTYGSPEGFGYPGYATPPYDPMRPGGPAATVPGAGAPTTGMPPYPFGYPSMGSGAPLPPAMPGMGAAPMPPYPFGYSSIGSGAPMSPAMPAPNAPGTTPPVPPAPPRPDWPLYPPPGGAPNYLRGAAPNGFLPPAGPFLPPGPMTPYDGNGPQPGANQPYLVPREAPPVSAPPPLAQPLPPYPVPHQAPPPPAPEFDYEPAPYIHTGPPNEPYTLYEGPRYLAEVRLEHSRAWIQASYMHWWVRPDHTPALVTAGGVATPNTGAIGNPDTAILLGNGSIAPTEFSGVQLFGGMWLDPERVSSLEIGGFWVGKNSRQYNFASGPATPVLAQPIQTPAESALYFSLPTDLSGQMKVNSIMDFHSAEMNYFRSIYRLNGWSFDYLVGLRYLYLNDTLTLNQNVTTLTAGALPFNGVPTPAGSNFQFYDSFNATNRFYGGQIGLRLNWAWRCWDFGAVGKLGLGGTAHTVIVDGITTFALAGSAGTTAVGSTLAQPSNIGRHTVTDFSVVPELNATVGYQLFANLRLFAGYNIFGWTAIERPSSQIDRAVDLTQSPTSATFVPNRIGANPIYLNSRGEFWAQGLNVGMELKY